MYNLQIQKGLIKNETIGFYIGKAYLFLKQCGVNEKKMRFRQHSVNELAHYASECWDLECLTSYVCRKFSICDAFLVFTRKQNRAIICS